VRDEPRLGITIPAAPSLREWEDILVRLQALLDRWEALIERIEAEEAEEDELEDDDD
jgi:hypothetical protein